MGYSNIGHIKTQSLLLWATEPYLWPLIFLGGKTKSYFFHIGVFKTINMLTSAFLPICGQSSDSPLALTKIESLKGKTEKNLWSVFVALLKWRGFWAPSHGTRFVIHSMDGTSRVSAVALKPHVRASALSPSQFTLGSHSSLLQRVLLSSDRALTNDICPLTNLKQHSAFPRWTATAAGWLTSSHLGPTKCD